jgi:fructose-1,6-bisphosphatase I
VQPPIGAAQVCAGYAIYGPSTIFVLATEHGVNGFTLDRAVGEFVLTHPSLTIAHEAQDFAINTSSSRFWTSAIKRYVDECVAGHNGPRGRDFNMRWNGSLVTELHRTLMRGGLCCYPRDPEGRNESRCLRLVRDANPSRTSWRRRAAPRALAPSACSRSSRSRVSSASPSCSAPAWRSS